MDGVTINYRDAGYTTTHTLVVDGIEWGTVDGKASTSSHSVEINIPISEMTQNGSPQEALAPYMTDIKAAFRSQTGRDLSDYEWEY